MRRRRAASPLVAAASRRSARRAGPGADRARAPPEPQLVAMGTGSITGVYFPVGVALCRLVNQHRRETGLRCAATPVRRLGRQHRRPARRRRSTSPSCSPTPRPTALDGTGAFAAAGPFAELCAR